ncbi:MAG: 3-hydroxyisobutyrate dehydrogenase [Sphingomonas bacterium]|uniref:NAD(P)-dependent oxidoreductase n=1 Tax=Sphingomonas bacterium TaxID=1895847 RepID=UPI00260C31E8|nr:NAD(P)-dependent oxidoreductase [Sphingomonas bacterium]MDB5702926.1 3-hydroxyisobutyrate dehydrogenase [Sphingomonas bacterium]
MSTQKPGIGFVGLGRMGATMASNLVAAGYPIVGFVRRPEQVEALARLGIQGVTGMNPILDCDIVVTMLPDDKAVREVVFGGKEPGLAAGLAPGAIHLSMSTISPHCAGELAAEHGRRSQGYVAAPVLGNPDAARARQLFVLAAGAAADIERCRPLFDCLGQRTFVIGADPGGANFVKLASNAMSGATAEILGEVMALARKRGSDPAQLLSILTQTMFAGRAVSLYGEKIAAQHYAPGGFTFPLGLKDIKLALAEAEAVAVPMPTLDVVRDRLIAGIEHGYAGLDLSALGLVAADAAGLDTPNEPIAGPAWPGDRTFRLNGIGARKEG